MAPHCSPLSSKQIRELAVAIPGPSCFATRASGQGSEAACVVDKPCFSHGSFEDYDYEQELDRWLTAEPISCFPNFEDGAMTFSETSADARLISEALAECSENSTMLNCVDIVNEERENPVQPGNEKDTEDLADLLCCSTSSEGSSFAPCTSLHVAAAEREAGPTESTSESASNSPRCVQSVFSSKLTPSLAFMATAFSHKSGGPCDHCAATGAIF